MKLQSKLLWLSPCLQLVTFAAALAGIGTHCFAQSEQVIRYNGGSEDRARAVTTDSAGNIIVGGMSRSAAPIEFTVVKFNSQGAQQWASRYQGASPQVDGNVAAVATDAAGNIYAVGHIARQLDFMTYKIDWLVVSLSPNGAQRWAHVYNNPVDGYEQAACVAIDTVNGALYVSGITGDGSDFDWLTTKYSLAGTVLWQRTETGALNGDDRPVAAKLDGSGNLVVLGFTSNTGTGFTDLSVVKYDSQGNVLWGQDFAEASDSNELPGGLAIDPSGNVYTTGTINPQGDPEGETIPFTIKFNAAGVPQFILKGDTSGGSSVAIAPDGSIVVAGTTIGPAGSTIRSAVSKFSSLGAQLWTVPVDTGGEVAVDTDGTVYLGGTRFDSSGFDFYAAKLSASGLKIWDRVYTDGHIMGDAHLAANGDFLVTGDSSLLSSSSDMLTFRFPKNGVPQPAVPNAPSNLILTAAKGKLTLQWADNSNNETGFKIERSVNGGSFVQIAQTSINVRSYSDSGLNKRNTYAYRVRAFNDSGNSDYSNTASGKPN
jgi:hypothetical protein